MRVRTKRIACLLLGCLILCMGVFLFLLGKGGKEEPPPTDTTAGRTEGDSGEPLPVHATVSPLPATQESPSDPTAEPSTQETGEKLSRTEITYEVIREPIPYDTVRIPTDALMEGETESVTVGGAGYREIRYEVHLAEGVEILRKVLAESVVEPISETILVGKRSPTLPTGSFQAPLSGNLRITSYFGWRTLNGQRDYHYGVDFAAAKGTPVYAADGGQVYFAGKLGGISASYGNLIILVHGDTYRSYYAHLSSFAVKTGDAVAKGQVIGYSGATGNVTGPHLHFEIRKNGKLQDPLAYLAL